MSSGEIAGGSGISAIGDISQGDQQASTLRYQATIQDNNATTALNAAALNANKQQIQAQKMIGGATAAYGASGVEQTGSVAAVLGASAANSELDRQNILYGGEVKAVNAENQAHMDRVAATSATSAGMLNAASSMLALGGTMYSNMMGASPSGAEDPDDDSVGEASDDEVAGGAADAADADAGVSAGAEVDSAGSALAFV